MVSPTRWGEVILWTTFFVDPGIIVFWVRFEFYHEHLVKGSGSPTWSAYTDHNPIEVRLAKGWVFRQPPKMPVRRGRPHWASLRGVGEGPSLAKAALATELERRMQEEQPQSWATVADLGLEVASAVLGPEPPKDSRPWVLGFEAELQHHDVAVAQASSRKRSAVDDEGWRLPKGNGDRRNVVAQHGLGTRGIVVGGSS